MSEKLPFTFGDSEPTNEVEETPAEFQPLGEEALRGFSGEELNKYGEDLDAAIAEKKKRLEELKSASGESTGNSDLVSPEEAAETANNAPQNKGIKAFFAKKSNIVAAAIVAGLLTISLLAADISMAKSNQGGNVAPEPTPMPTAAATPAPGDSTPASADAVLQDLGLEIQNEQKGIKDGYGEQGLWLSENKDHDYNYSSAVEVIEMFDGDEILALQHIARNEVEALADYMAEFPEELCPEGFYGLSPREIEAKLESLPPEEFSKIQEQALKVLGEAFTGIEDTNDGRHHHGMELEDEAGPVAHENMELTDHGVGPGRYLRVYWTDSNGKVIGSMLINVKYKYNNGSIEEGGAGNIEEGGGEVLRKGKTTTPTKTETPASPTTPPETPAPKNQKEADENSGAGGIVTPGEQNRDITGEPQADEEHKYNQDANTYNSTPVEEAAAIGYEVIKGPETTEGAPGEAGTPSDFDASATVATGEVTGDTESADSSGRTIAGSLDTATGVEGADYGGTGF